ncbi:winged helix-turn-helix domain-containing protein [Baileyella intestinalis]|uniref:winged helix-turn-helix domain-containing protein n=1 Tax=Baileyella intestinalis TaxID=2606709 RepID=UPI0022E4801D|nr:winged helix-turn-helix domain-containing protein [Baileyella intestinalis]
MAIPKYDELMKPMLEAISDGGRYTMKSLERILADREKLTDAELKELLPSGRQTVFKNRIGWAKTYLKKAGLLYSPARATVEITDAGRQVLKENPDKINSKYLDRFPGFHDFVTVSDEVEPSVQDTESRDMTPDDMLEESYKKITDSLADELLEEVMKIKPYTFEKLVVDLLSHMGYGALEYGSHATVASGDDGIDGIIMEDKLGFNLIYMQAKEWALDRVVGQPEIQNFVGAIAGKHGDGLFVTTARFSQKAVDYAAQHHIILIDGKKLARLMIEYNFCVSVKKSFEIKSIDTDALNDYLED